MDFPADAFTLLPPLDAAIVSEEDASADQKPSPEAVLNVPAPVSTMEKTVVDSSQQPAASLRLRAQFRHVELCDMISAVYHALWDAERSIDAMKEAEGVRIAQHERESASLNGRLDTVNKDLARARKDGARMQRELDEAKREKVMVLCES
ncbi:hypothetical protein PINS_up006572 [Pythium insidiosum]|nr:hypothetical protein PINS_up006572 [Pythium insidiosum]